MEELKEAYIGGYLAKRYELTVCNVEFHNSICNVDIKFYLNQTAVNIYAQYNYDTYVEDICNDLSTRIDRVLVKCYRRKD